MSAQKKKKGKNQEKNSAKHHCQPEVSWRRIPWLLLTMTEVGVSSCISQSNREGEEETPKGDGAKAAKGMERGERAQSAAPAVENSHNCITTQYSECLQPWWVFLEDSTPIAWTPKELSMKHLQQLQQKDACVLVWMQPHCQLSGTAALVTQLNQ